MWKGVRPGEPAPGRRAAGGKGPVQLRGHSASGPAGPAGRRAHRARGRSSASAAARTLARQQHHGGGWASRMARSTASSRSGMTVQVLPEGAMYLPMSAQMSATSSGPGSSSVRMIRSAQRPGGLAHALPAVQALAAGAAEDHRQLPAGEVPPDRGEQGLQAHAVVGVVHNDGDLAVGAAVVLHAAGDKGLRQAGGHRRTRARPRPPPPPRRPGRSPR